MKNKIKQSLAAMLVVPLVALGASAVLPGAPITGVAGLSLTDGAETAKGDNTPDSLFGDGSASDGIFKTIVDIMLFIIGAISVIMLIIGGIRYTISGGQQTAIEGAKNTIMYAVIGIIVAILAYAIVNFVIGSLSTP